MSLSHAASFDVLLRHGTVYDGSGQPPRQADVALRGDRIAAIGDLSLARARTELDVTGLAVAPGFINMLSWATESLLVDGRSQSDLRQGVTLEVMGEGTSMGPLNPAMKRALLEGQGDLQYDVAWTTLAQYLEHLERRGVSCNVASFIGATSVRIHELGYADRAPTSAELRRMQTLVRRAVEEGALGVASSLIYAPAFYAKTDELIALARVAAESDGLYISHLRSEGSRFVEALEEFLEIARRAGVRAEVYHLKAAGQEHWSKLETVLGRIEAARAEGLAITADMYPYTAAATGLDAAMPPWVQEGGFAEWARRLQDPTIRARVAREMAVPTDAWENFYWAAGSAENIRLVEFRNDALKRYTGQTLAEIARARGQSAPEAAVDLVVEDGSRVGAVYFLMSEENLRRQLVLPWVSFGSDSGSVAAEGVFLKSHPHPRAYGTFARVLGRYVREEKLLPLAEAVRRLTALPAETLRLDRRGRLAEGWFADVVVFDPAAVRDHATFDRPHSYATGVCEVFVNGVPVLHEGEHTGAKPGRVVRGPGWRRGAAAR